MLPRGLRNNNPGNLRHSAEGGKLLAPYIGEVRPVVDSSFRTFENIKYGYRALFKQLYVYFSRGLNTIPKIINTYAPSSENDTKSYIKQVVINTGIPETFIFSRNTPNENIKLVAAISKHENGIPANIADVIEGQKLSLEPITSTSKKKNEIFIFILALSAFYAVWKK